ncbi:hypothetical protein CISG_03423 [Coccidioides immitis RMSCC 3703]|uniref:Uncharacterized protein n=2 Tax=Coccidioides immitis TaxID=5501 RepID=A0A0J8THK1_COCIT|nr:hypothetical protein CIRG_03266 [Coccidioides immitis RMSCC 2394]KMU73162.1 hypothetical protein CISG_03423 [Coccidioides immitis RMSCC 3703]
MPIPLWEQRSPPGDYDIKHEDIAFAIEEFERMQIHEGLQSAQKEYLSQGLECFNLWIAKAGQLPTVALTYISGLLKKMAYLPRLCHLDHQALRSVCLGMRVLADHYTALKQDFPHEITQYEEFGDVFEPLTSVLRCDICFGGEKFNEIDPATGRQYDWSYIASVLKRYPYMSLPSWYQQSQALSAPPPIAETQTALIASLRLASTTLSIDFDAVAWQIIRYNVYLEVPRGPKLSLRTGNWRQLATSMDGALVTLRVVSQLMAEKYKDNSNSGHSLLRAVQCTQSKWFENFTSLDEFTLTNEAIELSRRLAETGDPRSDRDLRCEALYHIMSYKKVKASTILNQMQRAGENRSFQPSMAAQVPALGGQPQLDIYDYLPDHIAASDLSLTLLMAILHPSFYRASFIELLPTYAGHSERELEEVNLVRIPHRGLASKASFEGFFHVSMGRNTVPPNAEEVVGQILRAVEEGDQGTLDLHDFDINARNYEPLYSDDRALHLVSLLLPERIKDRSATGRPDLNLVHFKGKRPGAYAWISGK